MLLQFRPTCGPVARTRMPRYSGSDPGSADVLPARPRRQRPNHRGGRAMNYLPDRRVDAFIDALPEWQQDICRDVRELVHAADPGVEETIKRRVQPYFVLRGNVCALLAA